MITLKVPKKKIPLYAIRENKARKILEDIKKNKEPDLEDLEASLPEAPEQDLPEDSAQDLPVEMSEEKPKGLMARPEGVM